MFRIVVARSGSYYIQQRAGFGWSKIGPFFDTKRGARRYARVLQGLPPERPRVVEYL